MRHEADKILFPGICRQYALEIQRIFLEKDYFDNVVIKHPAQLPDRSRKTLGVYAESLCLSAGAVE